MKNYLVRAIQLVENNTGKVVESIAKCKETSTKVIFSIKFENECVPVECEITKNALGVSLIGLMVQPRDNSYCQNIKSKADGYLYGKDCIIVSNPYSEKVKFLDEIYTHEFVNVEYAGQVYRILKHYDIVRSNVSPIKFKKQKRYIISC